LNRSKVGFINKIFKKWNEKDLSKGVRDNELEASLTNQNDIQIPVEKSPTTTTAATINWSSPYKKEDWWAVWIELTIFALSLPSYFGVYILGWIPVAKPWTDITQALSTKVFDLWIFLN
jgi:hypothetical protein